MSDEVSTEVERVARESYSRGNVADADPKPAIIARVGAGRVQDVRVVQTELTGMHGYGDSAVTVNARHLLAIGKQVAVGSPFSCTSAPLVWLPGKKRMQPDVSVASDNAIQAVTCSAGSRLKYAPS